MDYKFCPGCGKELEPNSNACTECGMILNEKAVKEINNKLKNPTAIAISIDKDKIKDNVNSIYNNVKNIDTDKIKGNVNGAVEALKLNKKVGLIIGIAVIVVVIIIVSAIVGGGSGGNGNSKKANIAIETAEAYYADRMGDEYKSLTMNSTIAAADKQGVVYIVDIAFSPDSVLRGENPETNASGEVIRDDDYCRGTIIPIIFNESGTCTIAPDYSPYGYSYISADERAEILSQVEFVWITTI